MFKIGVALLIAALLALCIVVSSVPERPPGSAHPWGECNLVPGPGPGWDHPWGDVACTDGLPPGSEHPWQHDG
jgi:hypothetical protein